MATAWVLVSIALCSIAASALALPASTAEADTLKIFLVPHSHCDAGYRETINGYWRDRVSKILPNVITYLEKNKALKFVWDETIWLSYFMQTASQDLRSRFLQLVASQRLEIIGGGWVMHDEADSSLRSVLNQLTVGFDYLQAHVGARPKFQWHIDPFGHSALSPIVFAGLGYSAFVINRVPNDVKMARRAAKSLEFMWEALDVPLANGDSKIFAHLLDSHYSPPTLGGSSIPQKADSFASVVKARAAYYNTTNVLIPWGNDFGFMSSTDFEDLIMLIAAVRARHPELDLRVSTLSDYFQALHADPRAQFTTAQGTDFFPYIACSGSAQTCVDLPSGAPDAYWTGFYTSRPTEKYLSYQQDASLQSADTLLALAMLAGIPSVTSLTSLPDELVLARQASGLLQHHDAITGTSFNYCTISITECNVVSDYVARLSAALNGTESLAGRLKGTLVSLSQTNTPVLLAEAQLLEGLAQLTNDNSLALVLGNSLAVEREELYSITICDKASCDLDVVVANDKGEAIESQTVVDHVRDIVQVYFPVRISALGLQTLFLSKKKAPVVSDGVNNNSNNNNNNAARPPTNDDDDRVAQSSPRVRLPPKVMGDAFDISNGKVKISFSAAGRVTAVEDLTQNITLPFNVDLTHLNERLPPIVGNIFVGGNVYTFVPDGTPAISLLDGASDPILTASGPLVWQVDVPLRSPLCEKGSSCALTVRLLCSTASPLADNAFSIQPRVGPLAQFTNQSGSVLLTAGPSKGTLAATDSFTTDANGHLRLTRKYNHTRPLQGNMYPIIGGLAFSSPFTHATDSEYESASSDPVGLAALPAGPLAGTVVDETLQLMVHRRINDSDRRGDDSTVVDQPVTVLIGPASDIAKGQAQVAAAIASPLTLHWSITPSVSSWLANARATFAPVATPFPNSLNLVGLRTRFPSNLSHASLDGELLQQQQQQQQQQQHASMHHHVEARRDANANQAGDAKAEVGVWLQSLAGTAGGAVDLTVLGHSGWTQTSLDFQQPIATTRRARMLWRTSTEADTGVEGDAQSAAGPDTADVPPNAVVAFKVAIN
jgi:hypothetical protein